MKKKIFYAVLAVWLAVWAWFIVRDLFLKANMRAYAALIARDLEGKRSYVTGDRLYEFIKFCRDKVPAGSSYRFICADEGSVDKVRVMYYMYPLLQTNNPDYLLVYDAPGAPAPGGAAFAALDSSRYILKNREAAL